MRPAYTIVLSAVGGFVIGYAGSLVAPRAAKAAGDRSARSGSSEGTASSRDERKTSDEKIVSVLTLAEKARDDARDFELYSALQKLTAAELRELAPKMVETLKRLKRRAEALVKWAERDPLGAMSRLTDLIPELQIDVLGNRSVNELVSGVAEKDSLKAMEFVSTLPPEFRATTGIAAARIRAAKDPTGALDSD